MSHYRLAGEQEKCTCSDCVPYVAPKGPSAFSKWLDTMKRRILINIIVSLPLLLFVAMIGGFFMYENHVNSTTELNAYVWASHHGMRVASCRHSDSFHDGLICTTTNNRVLLFEDGAITPLLVGSNE